MSSNRRDVFADLAQSNSLNKKTDISSLYGYKYGYEISSPKKISTKMTPSDEKEVLRTIELPSMAEFIPVSNFEHLDFMRAEVPARKKSFVKKIMCKLKNIYKNS